MGEFRRPGGGFLFRVEKEPKDARGSQRIECGFAPSDTLAPPGPPFYESDN